MHSRVPREYEPARQGGRGHSEGTGGGGERRGGHRPNPPRRDFGKDRYSKDKQPSMASGPHTKPPVILSRSKPKSEPVVVPGSVAIISRDSTPSISPTRTWGSGGSGAGRQTHGPEGSSPPTSPPSGKFGTREEGYTIRSRKENAPSSFVPLQQPKYRSPRDRESVRDSIGMSRNEGSLSIQTPESTHAVKVLDESWNWAARATESLMDQPDFLVVGCLGLQGVGKSNVMSILAGSRTGSGRPPMFRLQSKDAQETQGFQTLGVDMVVTSERVILLDVQPILSSALMEQYSQSETPLPSGLSSEMFVELQSLQLAIFLMAVCHVIVVVMDTMETDTTLRFLSTAASLKPSCASSVPPMVDCESDASSTDQVAEHFPQIVFVHNHASPDDFQPYSMKQVHSHLAQTFAGSPLKFATGVSLMKSGVMPMGNIPTAFSDASVNLHLLPTNESSYDNSVPLTSRPEKLEYGLNPILSLLPHFTGHPSYQLLSETLRNQILAMPRPPLNSQSQQMSERQWFTYAESTWNSIKKSNLLEKYEELIQTLAD